MSALLSRLPASVWISAASTALIAVLWWRLDAVAAQRDRARDLSAHWEAQAAQRQTVIDADRAVLADLMTDEAVLRAVSYAALRDIGAAADEAIGCDTPLGRLYCREDQP